MKLSPVQDNDFACGPFAVLYLAASRGLDVMVPMLTKLTTADGGTSHEGICALLREIGLHPRERTLKIRSVPLFSIVNYQYDGDGHYGVLVAKTSAACYIFNPARGAVDRHTLDDFDAIFFSRRYGARWSVSV